MFFNYVRHWQLEKLRFVPKESRFEDSSLNRVRLISQREFDENKIKRDASGRFSKKTGKVSKPGISPLEQAFLDERREKIDPELYNNLVTLLENQPEFASTQEALDHITGVLTEMGITGLQDVKYQVGFPEEYADSEAVGMYLADENTMYILPEFEKEIASGDPTAVMVMVHELLHSNQEVERPLKPGETLHGSGAILDTDNTDEQTSFRQLLEGSNHAATYMAMSKIYGVPMTPDLMLSGTLVKDYTTGVFKEGEANAKYEAPYYYSDYVGFATDIARKYSQKTGKSYMASLQEMHDNGQDMAKIRKIYQTATGSTNMSPYFDYFDDGTPDLLGQDAHLYNSRLALSEGGFFYD